jgi:hypothetical protein
MRCSARSLRTCCPAIICKMSTYGYCRQAARGLRLLRCTANGRKQSCVGKHERCLHRMKHLEGCVPADKCLTGSHMLCTVAEADVPCSSLCCSVLGSRDGALTESVAGRWRRWGWRWLGKVGECAFEVQWASWQTARHTLLGLLISEPEVACTSLRPESPVLVKYRSHGALDCQGQL